MRGLVLLVLAGCATDTLPGDIPPLPSATKVRLAEVYFDYDTWEQASEAEKEKAREREPELTKVLADAFTAESKRLGIWSGGVESTKVTIAMVDTYPGSQITSEWLGYGAGQAKAHADVTLRGHGTFEMSVVIPDDDVEGRLKELGVLIARHINQRMR
ncbi:MAG: hypothetical protein ACYTHK_17980 [Planctomycetota bacterium]|jgi:hypothetical protein